MDILLALGAAAILINTADRVVAQTFTALHEFAHLVARAHDATNICDISDPWGNEETFANKVAGSALLPESSRLALAGSS